MRSASCSTSSIIKAKFRDHVRSKTPVAMVNEVLRKIICHSICVLIQETHELGIEVKLSSSSVPSSRGLLCKAQSGQPVPKKARNDKGLWVA